LQYRKPDIRFVLEYEAKRESGEGKYQTLRYHIYNIQHGRLEI